MLSTNSFQVAPHGRRFLPVAEDHKVPAKQVLDLLNDPRILEGMAFVTKSIDYPALGAIVKELEQNKEVAKYFGATASKNTLRFRQFVGMAVRLAMEEKGFRTTGKKGYIGSISKWFTRAEIFEPSSGVAPKRNKSI